MNLTEVETKYLVHLLDYADEELFIYSSNFLTKFGVKIEDVYDFIGCLKEKIEKGEI